MAMWPLLIILSSAGGAQTPLEETATRIQNHLDGVQNFEARFTQRFTRRILGKIIEEKGYGKHFLEDTIGENKPQIRL